jgi:hypothetical protein
MNFKNHSKATLVSYTAVVVAAVGVFFAQQTGTTGGEIRHTEIRTNATQATGAEQNAAGEQGEMENKD